MIVTVNSQQLAIELRLLNKIVPSKPPLAILSHALLRAEGTSLRLYATDLEIGLQTECTAQVDAPGTCALPVSRFLALVEQFPDGDVRLGLDKSQVVVKCGGHTSRLQAMPHMDFPPPAEVEGKSCTLDGEALRRMIDRTRYAVVTSGSKAVLQGALLTLSEGVGAMVATDGKRLALATMSRTGEDQRVIIPAKTLDVLSTHAAEGDVELTVGPRHLFFSVNGRLIISRTLNGEFPKYERIIPRTNDKVVTIDRSPLAAALRRVALVAEDTKAVYFNITPGTLELTAASAEVGSANESVLAEYDGPPLKVCVNGTYVLDFLNASLHPRVSLALKDALSPALLSDGTDHLGVVMLMRT